MGRIIVTEFVTGPPAYRRLDEATPDDSLESLRSQAREALSLPGVRVMNGYNERYPARVITHGSHPPRRASAWSGLAAAESGSVPPLEVSWHTGIDSLHALIRGGRSYQEILISATRSARGAVVVRPSAAAIDTFPGDTAARHFSAPLELLIEFTLADPGTILFVTSDHGMRPVWQAVHPNALLARAGLLAIDDTGAIVLSRTRVLSPDGYGVVVNRATRRGGIVRPDDEAGVVRAARRALDAATHPMAARSSRGSTRKRSSTRCSDRGLARTIHTSAGCPEFAAARTWSSARTASPWYSRHCRCRAATTAPPYPVRRHRPRSVCSAIPFLAAT